MPKHLTEDKLAPTILRQWSDMSDADEELRDGGGGGGGGREGSTDNGPSAEAVPMLFNFVDDDDSNSAPGPSPPSQVPNNGGAGASNGPNAFVESSGGGSFMAPQSDDVAAAAPLVSAEALAIATGRAQAATVNRIGISSASNSMGLPPTVPRMAPPRPPPPPHPHFNATSTTSALMEHSAAPPLLFSAAASASAAGSSVGQMPNSTTHANEASSSPLGIGGAAGLTLGLIGGSSLSASATALMGCIPNPNPQTTSMMTSRANNAAAAHGEGITPQFLASIRATIQRAGSTDGTAAPSTTPQQLIPPSNMLPSPAPANTNSSNTSGHGVGTGSGHSGNPLAGRGASAGSAAFPPAFAAHPNQRIAATAGGGGALTLNTGGAMSSLGQFPFATHLSNSTSSGGGGAIGLGNAAGPLGGSFNNNATTTNRILSGSHSYSNYAAASSSLGHNPLAGRHPYQTQQQFGGGGAHPTHPMLNNSSSGLGGGPSPPMASIAAPSGGATAAGAGGLSNRFPNSNVNVAASITVDDSGAFPAPTPMESTMMGGQSMAALLANSANNNNNSNAASLRSPLKSPRGFSVVRSTTNQREQQGAGTLPPTLAGAAAGGGGGGLSSSSLRNSGRVGSGTFGGGNSSGAAPPPKGNDAVSTIQIPLPKPSEGKQSSSVAALISGSLLRRRGSKDKHLSLNGTTNSSSGFGSSSSKRKSHSTSVSGNVNGGRGGATSPTKGGGGDSSGRSSSAGHQRHSTDEGGGSSSNSVARSGNTESSGGGGSGPSSGGGSGSHEQEHAKGAVAAAVKSKANVNRAKTERNRSIIFLIAAAIITLAAASGSGAFLYVVSLSNLKSQAADKGTAVVGSTLAQLTAYRQSMVDASESLIRFVDATRPNASTPDSAVKSLNASLFAQWTSRITQPTEMYGWAVALLYPQLEAFYYSGAGIGTGGGGGSSGNGSMVFLPPQSLADQTYPSCPYFCAREHGIPTGTQNGSGTAFVYDPVFTGVAKMEIWYDVFRNEKREYVYSALRPGTDGQWNDAYRLKEVATDGSADQSALSSGGGSQKRFVAATAAASATSTLVIDKLLYPLSPVQRNRNGSSVEGLWAMPALWTSADGNSYYFVGYDRMWLRDVDSYTSSPSDGDNNANDTSVPVQRRQAIVTSIFDRVERWFDAVSAIVPPHSDKEYMLLTDGAGKVLAFSADANGDPRLANCSSEFLTGGGNSKGMKSCDGLTAATHPNAFVRSVYTEHGTTLIDTAGPSAVATWVSVDSDSYLLISQEAFRSGRLRIVATYAVAESVAIGSLVANTVAIVLVSVAIILLASMILITVGALAIRQQARTISVVSRLTRYISRYDIEGAQQFINDDANRAKIGNAMLQLEFQTILDNLRAYQSFLPRNLQAGRGAEKNFAAMERKALRGSGANGGGASTTETTDYISSDAASASAFGSAAFDFPSAFGGGGRHDSILGASSAFFDGVAGAGSGVGGNHSAQQMAARQLASISINHLIAETEAAGDEAFGAKSPAPQLMRDGNGRKKASAKDKRRGDKKGGEYSSSEEGGGNSDDEDDDEGEDKPVNGANTTVRAAATASRGVSGTTVVSIPSPTNGNNKKKNQQHDPSSAKVFRKTRNDMNATHLNDDDDDDDEDNGGDPANQKGSALFASNAKADAKRRIFAAHRLNAEKLRIVRGSIMIIDYGNLATTSAAEAAAAINAFIAIAVPIVERFGGVVDVMQASQLLITFNYHTPIVKHEDIAAKCALVVKAALAVEAAAGGTTETPPSNSNTTSGTETNKNMTASGQKKGSSTAASAATPPPPPTKEHYLGSFANIAIAITTGPNIVGTVGTDATQKARVVAGEGVDLAKKLIALQRVIGSTIYAGTAEAVVAAAQQQQSAGGGGGPSSNSASPASPSAASGAVIKRALQDQSGGESSGHASADEAGRRRREIASNASTQSASGGTPATANAAVEEDSSNTKKQQRTDYGGILVTEATLEKCTMLGVPVDVISVRWLQAGRQRTVAVYELVGLGPGFSKREPPAWAKGVLAGFQLLRRRRYEEAIAMLTPTAEAGIRQSVRLRAICRRHVALRTQRRLAREALSAALGSGGASNSVLSRAASPGRGDAYYTSASEYSSSEAAFAGGAGGVSRSSRPSDAGASKSSSSALGGGNGNGGGGGAYERQETFFEQFSDEATAIELAHEVLALRAREKERLRREQQQQQQQLALAASPSAVAGSGAEGTPTASLGIQGLPSTSTTTGVLGTSLAVPAALLSGTALAPNTSASTTDRRPTPHLMAHALLTNHYASSNPATPRNATDNRSPNQQMFPVPPPPLPSPPAAATVGDNGGALLVSNQQPPPLLGIAGAGVAGQQPSSSSANCGGPTDHNGGAAGGGAGLVVLVAGGGEEGDGTDSSVGSTRSGGVHHGGLALPSLAMPNEANLYGGGAHSPLNLQQQPSGTHHQSGGAPHGIPPISISHPFSSLAAAGAATVAAHHHVGGDMGAIREGLRRQHKQQQQLASANNTPRGVSGTSNAPSEGGGGGGLHVLSGNGATSRSPSLQTNGAAQQQQHPTPAPPPPRRQVGFAPDTVDNSPSTSYASARSGGGRGKERRGIMMNTQPRLEPSQPLAVREGEEGMLFGIFVPPDQQTEADIAREEEAEKAKSMGDAIHRHLGQMPPAAATGGNAISVASAPPRPMYDGHGLDPVMMAVADDHYHASLTARGGFGDAADGDGEGEGNPLIGDLLLGSTQPRSAAVSPSAAAAPQHPQDSLFDFGEEEEGWGVPSGNAVPAEDNPKSPFGAMFDFEADEMGGGEVTTGTTTAAKGAADGGAFSLFAIDASAIDEAGNAQYIAANVHDQTTVAFNVNGGPPPPLQQNNNPYNNGQQLNPHGHPHSPHQRHHTVVELLDPHEMPVTFTDINGESYTRSRTILGRGAFGFVTTAMDDDGTIVAVKTMSLDDVRANHVGETAEAAVRARTEALVHEVGVLAEVRHAHIAGYVSAAILPSHFCILMEYLSGGSLRTLISSAHYSRIPTRPLMAYLRGILRGLQYLHEVHNYVHCDIKPDNVMLTADGTCKLTDFGTAVLMKKEEEEERRQLLQQVEHQQQQMLQSVADAAGAMGASASVRGPGGSGASGIGGGGFFGGASKAPKTDGQGMNALRGGGGGAPLIPLSAFGSASVTMGDSVSGTSGIIGGGLFTGSVRLGQHQRPNVTAGGIIKARTASNLTSGGGSPLLAKKPQQNNPHHEGSGRGGGGAMEESANSAFGAPQFASYNPKNLDNVHVVTVAGQHQQGQGNTGDGLFMGSNNGTGGDFAGSPYLTSNGPLVRGTPRYMAPEAALGDWTPATDVYSLGITVIELATGQHPWRHVGGSDTTFLMRLAMDKTMRPRIPPPPRVAASPSAGDDPEASFGGAGDGGGLAAALLAGSGGNNGSAPINLNSHSLTHNPNASAVAVPMDPRLIEFAERCLEYDPCRRATVSELLEMLSLA